MAYMRESWHSLALQGESPVRSPKRAKVVQTRAHGLRVNLQMRKPSLLIKIPKSNLDKLGNICYNSIIRVRKNKKSFYCLLDWRELQAMGRKPHWCPKVGCGTRVENGLCSQACVRDLCSHPIRWKMNKISLIRHVFGIYGAFDQW